MGTPAAHQRSELFSVPVVVELGFTHVFLSEVLLEVLGGGFGSPWHLVADEASSGKS